VQPAFGDEEDEEADAGQHPGLEEEAGVERAGEARVVLVGDDGHEVTVAELDQDGGQERGEDGGVEHILIIRLRPFAPHEPFGPIRPQAGLRATT
jgi:hypothetical protein